jgi:hypothetical protein
MDTNRATNLLAGHKIPPYADVKSAIPNSNYCSANTQIYDLIMFARIPERGNNFQIQNPNEKNKHRPNALTSQP